MNGQELATATQHGCDLIAIVIDNASYGTIRMHQERTYPGRVASTDLANPDFAAFGQAFGAWSKRVETTAAFAETLAEANERRGVRLTHCVTNIEQLSAAGATVSGLRAKR
jgi:acetolactate synthase-1/2/3 large subunit